MAWIPTVSRNRFVNVPTLILMTLMLHMLAQAACAQFGPNFPSPANQRLRASSPVAAQSTNMGTAINGPVVNNALPVSNSATSSSSPAEEPGLDFELFEPGKLVAKVGDLPIFYGDVLGDLNQIVEQEMPDASETLKDLRRKELFRQLLPRLIEQKTVYADFLRSMPDQSRVPEINKQLDQTFYDSEIPQLLKKLDVASTKDLEEKLESIGTSLRNVRQAWRESQIVGFYLGEKFNEEREVTHQEMLDYYREHIADYTVKPRVKWEQLMVRFDRFPSKDAALSTIEEMGNRVVYGARFDAVAKRESHGPNAADGGQYDWTSLDSLANKSIEKQLFKLPLRYLSDIIQTDDGYHIVRVQQREPGVAQPFVEVQTEIKTQILAADRKTKVDDFLETLQEEIPVWTIYDDEADAQTARDSFALPTR